MGLALVRKAVQDHGGSIDVVSDPEKGPGTTFRFTWRKTALPLAAIRPA
jgi:signal transduction histidine kinase